MKTIRPSSAAQRGFSLIELIVAMGISTILMAALASIFANSINAREKIDREGQKIETARYSLDTLAEDIRLAGYYGSYSPPFTGATPADWKYVDPCSTTGGNPLPGWNPATAPVQVPFPIFGYEAHGTGSLPAALTGCLDNYRDGTDVLVIRRASTRSVTAGDTTADPPYVAGDPYMQVSSCPDGTVDGQAFHAIATATSTDFNLHVLGCNSLAAGPTAAVRKLITRIYYVSDCDDCVNDLDKDAATTGDGIPTLKMVELGIPSTGGSALKVKENLRTIAPGVENLHLEYGVDGVGQEWLPNTAVATGEVRYSGNYYYTAAGAGTTGTLAPGHVTGSASDGGVTWNYSGSMDGATDSYIVSNANPFNGTSGTLVAGMRTDSAGENRWEDVMSVKLFLITRDLQSTRSYVDSKSYVMGSITVAAVNDPFRRRLTATTVKLINMSGRRETP